MTTCTKCGFEDEGDYCSACAYPLNGPAYTLTEEINQEFVSKLFNVQGIIKFFRTWLHVFFLPGSIQIRDTYGSNARYTGDVKFLAAIFGFALATSVLSSVQLGITPGTPDPDGLDHTIFLAIMKQIFLFGILYFSFLGFVWTGKKWNQWMGLKIEDSRQFNSIYIYEVGSLVFVYAILSLTILKPLFSAAATSEDNSDQFMAVTLGLSMIRILWVWIVQAVRHRLSFIKAIIFSVLGLFLFLVNIFIAEFYTIFIILTPILLSKEGRQKYVKLAGLDPV